MSPDLNKAIAAGREFLKDSGRLTFDFSATDQSRGIPAPPFEKTPLPDAVRVRLPGGPSWKTIGRVDVKDAIRKRRSRRTFLDKGLSLEELSFLLWATQGVQRVFGTNATFRTVPSAGARHALETYLGVNRVEGLVPGLYRYLPLEHELVREYEDPRMGEALAQGCLGQSFAGEAAVVFIWSAVPYRMEWRYGPVSHKVIALDAGHVCQNLYLACEAVSCGTCAIAAYDQSAMDSLIRADGSAEARTGPSDRAACDDEFVIYVAPVGKIAAR